jgi:dihydroxyacetone kinase-like predicted kinase
MPSAGAGPQPAGTAVISVVTDGPGIADVFRSLGVRVVASMDELRRLLPTLGAGGAVILPNDPQILAECGATGSAAPSGASGPWSPGCGDDPGIVLVPTVNIPQGLAAAVAYSPTSDARANVTAMERALKGVHSIEILRGGGGRDGCFRALLNGRRVATQPASPGAGCSPETAASTSAASTVLAAALGRIAGAKPDVVTICAGAGVTDAEVRELADGVEARFPGVAVELVDGGQETSYALVSVEREAGWPSES